MASTALRRPVGHEDRLSLIEHLDELRSRLIVCVLVLAVTVGACFALNGTLIDILNRPLEKQTEKSIKRGRGPLGQIAKVEQSVSQMAGTLDGTLVTLASPSSKLPAAARARFAAERRQLRVQRGQLPKIQGNKPITRGVGEPFSNTLIV